MFVGHYAVAVALIALFPGVDPVVALIGVGLPDLALSIFVLAGLEGIERDRESPLWTDIEFGPYQYSHSLVLSAGLWILLAIPLGAYAGIEAGVVLVLAATSHWLLDVVVHDGDLPVVGAGSDRYVGLGLWRRPRVSFVVEFLLFASATLLVLPSESWPAVLATGAVFNLMTVNASFGLARTNPVADAVASRLAPRFRTTNPAVVEVLFATQITAGYAGMTLALAVLLGS